MLLQVGCPSCNTINNVNIMKKFQLKDMLKIRNAFLTSSQKNLTKGSRRIFHVVQCNVTSTRQEHYSQLACRYWGLNDPYCCIHRHRDSQYFSMGRTNRHDCPFTWRISTRT